MTIIRSTIVQIIFQQRRHFLLLQNSQPRRSAHHEIVKVLDLILREEISEAGRFAHFVVEIGKGAVDRVANHQDEFCVWNGFGYPIKR